MVAFIEPEDPTLEREDVERKEFYPLFDKGSEIGGGRVKTTDIIIDQFDRDSALNSRFQFVCQPGAEMILVYEVIFQQDGMFSGTDGGKKRLKKLAPPLEKDDAVMTMGDRQLPWPKPP
jgi:hypothetical protein